MTEDFDVRPSKTKRRIVAISALVVIFGVITAVVVLVFFTKKPSAACDHIEELAKTDPRGAESLVDAIVNYAGTHVAKVNLVNGKTQTMGTIEGDTPDEQCRNAMSQIQQALGSTAFDNLEDCLKHVKSSAAARAMCFPRD